MYSRWTKDLIRRGGWWFLRFTEESLRRFYVEDLIFPEVGHHVDRFNRRCTNANVRQAEDFAMQYAVYWSQAGVQVYEQLGESGDG